MSTKQKKKSTEASEEKKESKSSKQSKGEKFCNIMSFLRAHDDTFSQYIIDTCDVDALSSVRHNNGITLLYPAEGTNLRKKIDEEMVFDKEEAKKLISSLILLDNFTDVSSFRDSNKYLVNKNQVKISVKNINDNNVVLDGNLAIKKNTVFVPFSNKPFSIWDIVSGDVFPLTGEMVKPAMEKGKKIKGGYEIKDINALKKFFKSIFTGFDLKTEKYIMTKVNFAFLLWLNGNKSNNKDIQDIIDALVYLYDKNPYIYFYMIFMPNNDKSLAESQIPQFLADMEKLKSDTALYNDIETTKNFDALKDKIYISYKPKFLDSKCLDQVKSEISKIKEDKKDEMANALSAQSSQQQLAVSLKINSLYNDIGHGGKFNDVDFCIPHLITDRPGFKQWCDEVKYLFRGVMANIIRESYGEGKRFLDILMEDIDIVKSLYPATNGNYEADLINSKAKWLKEKSELYPQEKINFFTKGFIESRFFLSIPDADLSDSTVNGKIESNFLSKEQDDSYFIAALKN
jgi:hypothetical protein